MPPPPRKILISRHDALGDLITTFPLIVLCHRIWPEAKVFVFCQPTFERLVRRELPFVAGTIPARPMERKRYGLSRRQARQNFGSNLAALRSENFDLVVAPYITAPLAWLFFRARIPWRLGRGRRWYSVFFSWRQSEKRKGSRFHESLFNLRVLLPLNRKKPVGKWLRGRDEVFFRELHLSHQPDWSGILVPEVFSRPDLPAILAQIVARRRGETRFGDPNPSEEEPVGPSDKGGSRPYLVIHPFKSQSSLKWPPEYFARLGQALLQDARWSGWDIWLTGTPPEAAGIAEIRQEMLKKEEISCFGHPNPGENDQSPAISPSKRVKIATELSLVELSDLLTGAGIWVGNSTGPLHLASWLQIPVLGLFGRAPEFTARRWGPVYGPVEKQMGREGPGPDCPRCIGRRCPVFNCLEQISPAEVLEEMVHLARPEA